jgi:predicted negative regulator of RcsB-dependent stress response
VNVQSIEERARALETLQLQEVERRLQSVGGGKKNVHIFLTIAREYIQLRLPESAMIVLEAVSDFTEDFAQIACYKGNAFFAVRRFSEASEHYARAVEHDPDDPMLRKMLELARDQSRGFQRSSAERVPEKGDRSGIVPEVDLEGLYWPR